MFLGQLYDGDIRRVAGSLTVISSLYFGRPVQACHGVAPAIASGVSYTFGMTMAFHVPGKLPHDGS